MPNKVLAVASLSVIICDTLKAPLWLDHQLQLSYLPCHLLLNHYSSSRHNSHQPLLQFLSPSHQPLLKEMTLQQRRKHRWGVAPKFESDCATHNINRFLRHLRISKTHFQSFWTSSSSMRLMHRLLKVAPVNLVQAEWLTSVTVFAINCPALPALLCWCASSGSGHAFLIYSNFHQEHTVQTPNWWTTAQTRTICLVADPYQVISCSNSYQFYQSW